MVRSTRAGATTPAVSRQDLPESRASRPPDTILKCFPAAIAKVARRKLIMVDAADVLDALKSPPGNRLEALKGDLAGKYSIRINDQWRIVFKWTDTGPEDVEILDYH
ncbi:type II toxin-antitoxin system RelE/ParE family toxin [Bradyrhizobium sp. A5]|uniref:type II toxin-antitoxin system RelE/ParE family toxin n=1 Tax=Bradyrhizobium sp. A5 TaxID=3133696 RepID=UPI003253E9AC